MLPERSLIARCAEEIEVGVCLRDVVPPSLCRDHMVAAGTPRLGRPMLAGSGCEVLETLTGTEMHADQ